MYGWRLCGRGEVCGGRVYVLGCGGRMCVVVGVCVLRWACVCGGVVGVYVLRCVGVVGVCVLWWVSTIPLAHASGTYSFQETIFKNVTFFERSDKICHFFSKKVTKNVTFSEK